MLGIAIFPVWANGHETDTTVGGGKSNDTKTVVELIEQARAAELNGDVTRRNAVLEQAFQIAGTSNATLNSLRGLVYHDFEWKRPDNVSLAYQDKKLLDEYRRLRDGSPDSPEYWLKLGQWCLAQGMYSEYRANMQRLLDADPENETARLSLGHIRLNHRWVTPEQTKIEVASVRAATERFSAWEKPIRKLGTGLSANSKKKRSEALEELSAIEDPTAITALEVILGPRNETCALAVIDKIAQFSEREAGDSLMRFATESRWESCRDSAFNYLRQRDRYEVLPRLIGMLETPVNSEIRVSRDGASTLCRQVFIQQGIDRDFVREFDSYVTNVTTPDSFDFGGDQFNAIRSNDELINAYRSIHENMLSLEALKSRYNSQMINRNRQIQSLLQRLTGEDPGPEAIDWMKWWFDYNEVKVYEKSVSVRRESNTRYVPVVPRRCECFVAGTLVTPNTGLVAIETIRTGDKVLSRNIEKGSLEFCPVIQPTVRESTPTLKLKVGNETLHCSKGHPFWVVGQGWDRARNLKVGQRVASVDGSFLIESIEEGEPQVLYNLVVDSHSNYFVGNGRILSHDNTIQQQGSLTIANRLTR
ncbi:MAG: polymorphic toxin-type HINT domain-containing protein [Pirellulaceae bacterium]